MTIQIVDYRDPRAPERFAASLREIGFAVLSHHPIPQKQIDTMYERWNQFFHSEEKHKFSFDRDKHDGFIADELSETAKGHKAKDLKEFYHFYPWGRCPKKLQSETSTLFNELSQLAHQLLQWVENQTPNDVRRAFSMPLCDMIQGSERTLFRIIHYPPLTGDEPADALRAAPHEDINLLTLLPAATAEGLEVKNKEGVWVSVPCNHEWLIVNTGDMLQECSGGYYPSTTHRVVNPMGSAAKKSRLSMPLFLHPADHVRLSEQYTAESYRLQRYKELGLD